MISVTDSSHFIKYNHEKSHNELLKTINATVNHELRNPLNSIVAFNQQKKTLYGELEILINNDELTEQ